MATANDSSVQTDITDLPTADITPVNENNPPERHFLKLPNRPLESVVVNGSTNTETKPPFTTKCMNILQNIVIKRDDLIPIKREIDDDLLLNNRAKVLKRDESSNMVNSSIKEEVLDIKSEVHEAANGTIVEREAVSENKNQMHTCYVCNMIFMDKKAYTIHSRQCGRPEPNYTSESEQAQSSSTNSTNNQGAAKTNNYMIHLDQVPRLIESIRNTQCLYNDAFEGYNNVELKQQMWSQIAHDCGFTNGKIAKNTWENLLLEFHETLNKRHSGNIMEPYRYEQQLQFMIPFIDDLKTTINHNDTYNSTYTPHANFTGVPISTEIIEDDDAQSVMHVATPKRQLTTPFVIRQTEPPAHRPPPPNTARALDLFFMSMCESTKSLPFNLQLQVKKKIFESIMEAEEIVNSVNHIRNEPYSPPPTPGHFQY